MLWRLLTYRLWIVFLRYSLNCFLTHSTSQLNKVEGIKDCHIYSNTLGQRFLLYIWSISCTFDVPPTYWKKSRYSSTSCSSSPRSRLILISDIRRFMIAYDLFTVYLLITMSTWFHLLIENVWKQLLVAVELQLNFWVIIFSSRSEERQASCLCRFYLAVVVLWTGEWV